MLGCGACGLHAFNLRVRVCVGINFRFKVDDAVCFKAFDMPFPINRLR